MAEPTPAEQPEKWDAVGEQFFTGLISAVLKSNISKAIIGVVSDVLGAIVALALTLMSPIGLAFTRAIGKAQDDLAPAMSEFAAAGVNQMFDTNIPASSFEGGTKSGSRKSAADALADGLLKQLVGTHETLTPGDEAATRYLGVMVKMALEGWYQGWFFEWITSLVPEINIGQIENYGALDEKMSEALGLGRLSRRVLSPLIDASIVTPLEWHVRKKYRPTLLGPSAVARQWARGRWDWADVVEELARQGYDDVRIDALINEQGKSLSVADVRQLLQREYWTSNQALAHLGEAGYDQEAAELALRVEGTKRFEQQENAIASTLVSAYASRDIDDADFEGTLSALITPAAERALVTELAHARRALNVKHLAPGEVEGMVRSGVLAMIDYRESLRRAGYTEFAVTAKELQLRWELAKDRKIEDHRAELEADRTAEKARKDAAVAKKLADVEAARQLARRGDEADLEAAAIRGLIQFARVEEVYRVHYDDDTVRVLVALLEGKRQDYLAEQQRRTDAEQRAASRGLSIADLEAAVLEGVLDINRYRAGLLARGLSADDADVLVRTLQVRKKEHDAAQAIRERARAAATKKGIDLGRYEQLVRRGVRTIGQYQAQLVALDFSAAAVADMTELLQLEIRDDAKARAARGEGEAALNAVGLSLEELRRAVILGLKSENDYAALLSQQKFTADKQVLLLAELEQAVSDAVAARARRDKADAGLEASRVPLSTLARAARLGLVTPGRYQARLVEDGYTDADVVVEMDLLTAEIADVQAARAVRNQVEPAAKARGLSLAELASAVKRGLKQLPDYLARALQLGLSSDAANTITRILADEVRELKLARDRRDQAASALAARNLSLGDLEAAVRSGSATIDDYAAQLELWGFSPDDAALLSGLLSDEL